MTIFRTCSFGECDINDDFFRTLRQDYGPDFDLWFAKKTRENEQAYVFRDQGIQAFLYVKSVDDDSIPGVLPRAKRMKIGTLKISEESQGQRIGEGAIGIALWRWQQSDLNEIFVTVFPKHDKLIHILESFGFHNVGSKANGEFVFVKDKSKMDYSSAKTAFPFIDPAFSRGKYIPINDIFHDTLFQYSELMHVKRPSDEDAMAASNGLSKVYIATPNHPISHGPGDVAIIYRIHTGDGLKKYKSVATSFCTVTRQIPIKTDGRSLMSRDDYLSIVGNKSVYSQEELVEIFDNAKYNLIVIEMMYNGYFGPGHNVTYDYLKTSGFFEGHPYDVELTKDQVFEILRMGGKDVRDIIIN